MKEETRRLLDKAQRALRAAQILLQAEDADSAAGRAYYAMFHTAQALLREKDLQFAKHGSVHAAYGRHFAKTGLLDPKFHRWLLAAFQMRIKTEYDIDSPIQADSVSRMIEHAEEFLRAAAEHLAQPKE